jgi:hypothetical protein
MMNGDTAMTSTPTSTPATRLLPAAGTLRMTPGRVLTLAIGVPVILALIAWTGFSFIAQAGQASFPIADTIPVNNGVLQLVVGGGNLAVHGGNQTTARLTGRVQYSLVRPKFTENNTASGTTVGVDCQVPAGNCGLDATLNVPPKTALGVSSGGGDLTVSGVQTKETLATEGGDLTVSGGQGQANLATGGGDLTANDMAGPLGISTSGGDIGSSDLTSSSVTANSGGGDVALVFTQVPRNLNIVSDGGDIALVLPHGDTSYDITTTSGGGDVSELVTISPSSPDRISVDSGGGDISISAAG